MGKEVFLHMKNIKFFCKLLIDAIYLLRYIFVHPLSFSSFGAAAVLVL